MRSNPACHSPIRRSRSFSTARSIKLKGVKTQREIAVEIGYDKPNMISMFKRGEMKVPLEKIPALAKAVEADPAHLFRLALEQYWPSLGETIQTIFGRLASANEEQILL